VSAWACGVFDRGGGGLVNEDSRGGGLVAPTGNALGSGAGFRVVYRDGGEQKPLSRACREWVLAVIEKGVDTATQFEVLRPGQV